jgi:hypothetical protein
VNREVQPMDNLFYEQQIDMVNPINIKVAFLSIFLVDTKHLDH